MKKGFTVMSLVLYVMLFFTFTVFATAVSTNLNYKTLSEKGRVIINESCMKLYTNLLDSAKKSTSYDIIGSKIAFSNGDVYEYIESSHVLLKNSGNLVKNVEDFSTNSSLEGIIGSSNSIDNIDTEKCFSITVSFKKYNETISKDMVVTVGDDLYE